MERLTRRSADGRACFKPHLYGQMNKDVCDRLAAYEDTGLEPEDFKRAFSEDTILKLAGQALGITPDRLRELAQTDKDGKIKRTSWIAFIAISARNGTPEQKKLRSI